MDEFKQLRIDKINEALLFYEEYFTKCFATVISLTEIIPEQMNNDIRNALSHLLRINIVQTELEIFSEADKAIGHIEIACRDCLKICISEVHDKITIQFNYVLPYYKAISPQHIAEIRWLLKERNDIDLAETNGEKFLINRFEEVLNRMLDLQTSFQPRKSSKIKLLLTQWFGAGIAGAVGKIIILFVVFIAGWLANYFEIIK
jgi:hypothetical protein